MDTTSKHLLVVGGGPAGCAAALEGANLGFRVTLIDEHPQDVSAMSLDAPYFYGARLPSVLSDQGLVADRVLGSNEPLMECLEAGVDVLTGTAVWSNFQPGANNIHLQVNQVGVADTERSWMIEYDYIVLAPGSRDLVLSFPGWELPGVLGANGATTLLGRYDTLGGSELVILGSGNLALRTAKLALEKGLSIKALVEVGPTIAGDPEIAKELSSAGVAFHLSTTVTKVDGQTGVKEIQLVKVDDALRPRPGTEYIVSCDTVCMAFGVVPNIELASVTGCKMEFQPQLAGWIPETTAQMQTSVSSVFVVGDGAGVTEASLLDADVACEQGRTAARRIAELEGLQSEDTAPSRVGSPGGSTYPPDRWLASFVAAQGLDVVVCQCEEVSRRELIQVGPPRYLDAKNRCPSGGLDGLGNVGRTSQDLLKRLTRAGMGHCQGKRCRDQTLILLADATNSNLADISPGSYRCPVRPIPLKVMWADDETEEIRRTWPTWLHPLKDEIPWK
ncbi:FAD-dependent oxidoreductase [Burkholderia humptydooensis]|uniref:FAD-dependent oxidoreductase n=2 Tax=Burkholderia humptydooensis TaxID=430531 RepID=A0A7U4P573_9BURK|nr:MULTISPECIES: FAD-dependent oxidoreductase [Burkholderia]AJY44001.1 pyridine nucleotide-disulfide oxidoreductase family protein [Burkholderia sp. 2002721687]ALX43185.1 (2Fe-2S)-binding protein [Burkholderia humptydooensis]EIP84720.1 sarcosine oxidase, subunit alpha [Burkholderia humptydooensis MSMB43]QPS44904.1 FAD-dependent oxidoreductase [Burkholderia humptydooensis]